MMHDYSFGSWIKRRRRSLDLTQQDLAARVGCSHSLIYKLEADARRPSRQIAELIADHLEIPAEQRSLFLKIARQEKNITNLASIQPLSVSDPIPTQSPYQAPLPTPPSLLIGRENEIGVITEQLRSPACRMLTLTGPGGIGKTRLAIEVAHRMQHLFSDGVFFISLAGVSMVESVVPTIADRLALGFSGPAEPLIQLAAHIQTKDALLVIDNMEHLTEAGSLLGEILERTENTRFLVTSREPLHLQWEWLFDVQGLPIPPDAGTRLETNSAFMLFNQRARQISSKFSLGPEDKDALVRICQLVGGSPLAIELAATWVRTLTCREIARELEKSLDILETKHVDVPTRHRSIRSVFDHSWKLLTEEEQTILMRLSIFQGGFTREAAQPVSGASLVDLSSLVDKSLVRHDRERDRYDLHELVKQYAYNRLKAHPGEHSDTLEQFTEYFADWIASLEKPFKSHRQPEVSLRIRAETSNWLAGWHWAIELNRLDLLRKMGLCLSWYLEVHGYYDEALSIFNAARDAARARGAPERLENSEDLAVYANLVDQVGWFEFRKGNLEVGEALLAESLEIARPVGDPEVLYYIFGNWGYMALWKGEFAKAEQMTVESLACSRQLTPWHTAIPVSVLGIVAYEQGDLNGAFEQLSESLGIWREVGDPRGLVFCMLYLGMTALALRDFSTTETVIKESNVLAEANLDRWAHAFGLDLLGMLALAQGQNQEAFEFFQESSVLFEEIGDKLNMAHLSIHKGQAFTALGEVQQAKDLFRETYAAAREARWGQIIVNTLISYAEIPQTLPAETMLAMTATILETPGLSPNLRARCEQLHAGSRELLTDQQIKDALLQAKEMPVESWAERIFR